MRRAGGRPDVLARTGAGIDETAGLQSFQRGAINVHPLALIVRRERPAAIRAFLPFKAKPSQILDHGRDKFHFVAGGIQILVPQNQRAAIFPRPLLRRPKCPRVAEMQIARRRRREPPAIFLKRVHSRQETGNRALLSIRDLACFCSRAVTPLIIPAGEVCAGLRGCRSDFLSCFFPQMVLIEGMTIWILALLLLAAGAGMGLRQGAIRVAISFVGIIISALLAWPLSGHRPARCCPTSAFTTRS